jgi:hypothetical protein
MTAILELDPFDHMVSPKGYPGTPFCDEVPYDVTRAVFERDGHACRFCGFENDSLGSYIGLHHRDHDHANNDPANLVPACMHCHGTHHAAHWAELGRARIVLLPEMRQADLSVLSRVVAVARLAQSYGDTRKGTKLAGMRKGADRLAASMDARAQAAKDVLGTDDPAVLLDHGNRTGASIDVRARLAPFRIWLTLESTRSEEGSTDLLKGYEIHSWMREEGPYGWLAAR